MKSEKPKKGIARKLTRSLFIGTLMVLAFISAVQIYIATIKAEELLVRNLEQYAAIAAPTFSQPLWNIDTIQTYLNLEGLTSGINIYGAKILDEKGMETASLGNVIQAQKNSCITEKTINEYTVRFPKEKCIDDANKLIAINKKITFSNQLVGSIIVYGNTDTIKTIVNPLIIATISSSAVILALLSTVLLILVEKQIGIPLRGLTKKITGFDPGEIYEKTWKLDGKLSQRNDEIGDLGKSFNEMAKKLGTYQNEMEELVAERTEKLRIANAAKSEFLSHMSHEIRTPINGVLGLSENILHTCSDQTVLKQIRMINESGKHLLNIVNDVLDLSKIEAGKLQLESTSFDLTHLIKEITNIFSNHPKFKELDYLIIIDPKAPKIVLGDPLRLKQVLINLINNAFKFTKQGKITLTIEKHQNDMLKFTITDTGIGISEAHLKKLFNAFEQLDRSTTRNYGGTGLGLTICKELVSLMDGEINVESKLGKGSSFSFTAHLPESSISEKPSEAPEEIPQINNDLRVLVAEDNMVNQAVIKGMLNRLGTKPVIADNGSNAIAIASTTIPPFDLIFMDCEMPIMDGWEASKKIRELNIYNQNNQPVLIIGLSAHAIEGANQRALDAGMNDYLTKPLSLEKLSIMLKKHNLID